MKSRGNLIGARPSGRSGHGLVFGACCGLKAAFLTAAPSVGQANQFFIEGVMR
jgi:hypothetical protein